MTSPTRDIVIGCDVGTSSSKAVALDRSGAVVARASVDQVLHHPNPGWAEQDATTWVDSLVRSIRQVAAEAGPERVAAIGVSAQVDGVVAVDRTGQPLARAILWLDRRASDESAALAERWGADAIRKRTGINVDASHGAAKVAWLRGHGGPAAEADAYLAPGAFVNAWLSGERVTDPAAASSMMLLDLASRTWATDLVADLGIDPLQLGAIEQAHVAVGTLRAAVATLLGLPSGVLVVSGTGDEFGACIGAGIVDPGVVGDITGTAEPVAAAATTPLLDPTGLVETHPHAAPDRWLLENPGFVSGGARRWLAEAVLCVTAERVTELAAGAPAGSDGLVFIPALGGAVTPRWNDRARGTFHGLRLGHDRRHLARAVLEGCAYALRDLVDRLDDLGLAGERVRILGGGARDALWPSIKADVTGRVMERLAEPEATALGGAVLAAVGAGWYPDVASAASASARVAPDVAEPDPARRDLYDDAYARYRAIFDALEPIAMDR
jgi:xylulokinase